MGREVLSSNNVMTERGRPTRATIRRRRIGVSFAGIVAAGSLGLGAHALLTGDSGSTSSYTGTGDCPTHIVQPGETRWGIASLAHQDEDPRAAVARLDNDNGIKKGQVLRVGTRLKVC